MQAMVARSQLEHGQDSSCPPLLSDTQPYWPRKHDVQGTFTRQRVFMKELLGHRVTLRSSPRQDDQNLNLINSCVGPAETALISSTCTATAQSFQQGLKMKLPHCGSNFTRSWLPREVKSVVLNDSQTRRPMAQEGMHDAPARLDDYGSALPAEPIGELLSSRWDVVGLLHALQVVIQRSADLHPFRPLPWLVAQAPRSTSLLDDTHSILGGYATWIPG
eukprot:symbB.v1.2.039674.t1/scaffold6717.1/size16020/1